MAEIRINATGGVKLYDADDSHYAQIVAGTITSNVDAITLGHDTVTIADNLSLGSDSAVLKFGADGDTTLTHTDGTGLTLNSTNKLTFGDVASYINQSSDGVLTIAGEATIDLTASTAVTVSNDLKLDSDAAVLSFGADTEIALTHVADTGLKLTDSGGTPTLQLHDANESIASDGSKVIITSGGTAFSLPTSDGSNGQVLATNGSGVLSFASAGGGDLSFGGDTFGENKTIGANDAYSLTLETNNAAAMVISAAGEITKPLQPCFAATTSAAQTNMTKGSVNTIVWGSETYDVNGDFASNTFTAPVTGKYLLTTRVTLAQMDHDGNFYAEFRITTSNRDYSGNTNITVFDAEPELWPLEIAAVVDMDASDTAYVTYIESGPGASQTDVYNADSATDRKYHVFSGCLLA